MKQFLIAILCLITGNISYALDIVYPKSETVTINSPTTFFVGSSTSEVTINGEKINIHPSGGFAYFVELKEGPNKFEIKSDEDTKIFNITRVEKLKSKYKAPEFKNFKQDLNLEITTENSPIRSTPADSGINRISHLQSGIILTSDGEKSGFYRIKLGDNNFGWISKSNVKISSEKSLPAQLLNYEYIENDKSYTHIFHLDRKVPFSITEEENLKLQLFNLKDCKDSIYTFEFPYKNLLAGKKLYGYSGYYDGNSFVLKIRKSPKLNAFRPLRGITIAIDAGHGGKEKGAIGCLGHNEKDIVLEISKHLEHELEHRGAHVVMTRKDDTYLGLRDRIDIANEKDSMFFISIHANALPDTMNPLEHSGTSIYYYYNQAKPFAETIINEIITQTGTKNDKVRQESFAVVRNTSALSILIEIAYMINPEDNAKLINPEFQKKCAKAITDGIVKYLSK